LALSLSVVLKVQATTTWTVCASGCDYSSIKAAIAAPTTLDGDTLAIAAGTYSEAGIAVNKSLTLQGEDVATTIVQAATSSGTAPDRVFTIPSGVHVNLRELTIRYGHVNNSGGGLSNLGTLTLAHSTVSGNIAAEGGGLSNEGTLTLTQSTVRGNRAAWGGGLSNLGTLAVTNSIVASQSDGGDCRHAGSWAVHTHGYNLDTDGSCQLTAPTDRPSTDPRLGPLQDNGGPTLTHALLPGSPALDVIPWGTNGCGTTLVSDQRWQA
jgi:hypothetical protein